MVHVAASSPPWLDSRAVLPTGARPDPAEVAPSLQAPWWGRGDGALPAKLFIHLNLSVLFIDFHNCALTSVQRG